LIVLRDGSRYRGIILESIPKDHITIAITRDELRRIPFEEVVYAGPLEGAKRRSLVSAQATTPLEKDQSLAMKSVTKIGESMVHIRTKTPGLVVWIAEIPSTSNATTDTGFRRLCEAPCREPIEHGRYRLAYSLGDRKPLEVKSVVNVTREGTLEAEIRSMAPQRILGWIVFGLSAATGTALISASTATASTSRRDKLIAGGIATMAGGSALGLPLALTSDTALVVDLDATPVNGNPTRDGETGAFKGLSWIGQF
jgi:hypothetical protein